MDNLIRRELETIQDGYGVTVLYACEAGSRCWGIASQDSDYDVRFIYAHDWEWYASLNERRDVIERVGSVLDISGWDLRKALRLFKKSNPPLLEWLMSTKVYWDPSSWSAELRVLLPMYYNPTATCYHYFHMAKGNYRDYLQGDGKVWRKKYLYVLRPLLAVRYIQRTGSMPPVDFLELVASDQLKWSVGRDLEKLLRDKRAGSELGYGPRLPALSKFITEEIKRLDQEKFSGVPATKEWDSLNQLFIDTVYTRTWT